jgi:transposase
MDVLIERCAGLDVHQASVVATVRYPGATSRESVTVTFGAMAADLLALREWLQAYGVTHVALESTGVYWKPVYYMLEEGFTSPGARPMSKTASGWRSCWNAGC